MTRAKKPQTVQVRMRCIYTGLGWSVSPGDLVEVEAQEADRLVQLGAADRVEDQRSGA